MPRNLETLSAWPTGPASWAGYGREHDYLFPARLPYGCRRDGSRTRRQRPARGENLGRDQRPVDRLAFGPYKDPLGSQAAVDGRQCASFSAFFIIWLVPEFAAPEGQWSAFAYYLVVAILFSTFSTALALPHASLTAELSRDYDERSRLTAYRMGFSLAGSVGGLVAALLVFHLLKNEPKSMQYTVFGASIGIIGLASVLLCLTGIWKIVISRDAQRLRRESADELAAQPLSLREQFDLVLSNKPFLLVCGIYLCSWLSMQFTATVLPFFTQSWLQLSTTTFHLLALTGHEQPLSASCHCGAG